MNLNHEYERSEEEREERGRGGGERASETVNGLEDDGRIVGSEKDRESANDRHTKRGSPSPDGNLVVAL